MMMNADTVDRNEDDRFVEYILREHTARNLGLHPETIGLLPYVDDGIFLREWDAQLH